MLDYWLIIDLGDYSRCGKGDEEACFWELEGRTVIGLCSKHYLFWVLEC